MIRFGLRFKQIKIDFFHFYFLNMDISFNIEVTDIQFLTKVENIHMEETVSQIFYLGLSFDFI